MSNIDVMIDIERLYKNNTFMKFLNNAININIPYFGAMADRGDYINDVFVEIMDSDCESIHECKQATWRVLKRELRSFKTAPSSVLWEDNHIIGAYYDTFTE